MSEKMNPILDRDRIISIDILRGIAILGIFLVNMPDFHSPFLYINPLDWWDKNPDRTLYIINDIFAQASFYPLFAFLFGFGAIILSERVQKRGQSFPLIFSRRLFALLLFGCIHAFLIWHGDILISYALCGFAFLLVYKMSGRSLLLLGGLLYFIPFFLLGLLTLLAMFLGEDIPMPTEIDKANQALEIYKSGSFAEITGQRAEDWYSVNGPVGFIFIFLSIFPLFMVGAAFAKLNWLHNPKQHKKILAAIMLLTGVPGILIKCVPYWNSYSYSWVYWQDQFGGPLLSIFYITFVVLILQNGKIYKLLAPFSYPGRLSMSNYLLQSIISTLLFYSYGLGLYGEVSFTWGTILVFIIFGIQILASIWWLRKFRLGPVEYVWRTLTYGKVPAMRRT
ncbi:DUF418 domain-containing protein [Peribacillus sp. SCS-155]|uniref:DUF418 domain-containing protein n=1 Tax=Peribacillus sedimenti TaxID=3115297 RepID=UPI003905D060